MPRQGRACVKNTFVFMDNKHTLVAGRDSSFELLRVISMIYIVFHHLAIKGDFVWEPASMPAQRLWYLFIVGGVK